MFLLTILLLALAVLFLLPGVLAARSDNAVQVKLKKDGALGIGRVRDYDSDDIVTVDFVPRGALTSISAQGRGHFLKTQFPPGSQMAVLYNPLCPAINAVAPERTEEALAASFGTPPPATGA